MSLPKDVNYEDVTVKAKVTGVEKAQVQATAYFTPPSEETKHIHERMLQMCLDDLNAKMEKKHGNSSRSSYRQAETGEKKVKKYRKRTESEKEARRQQKLREQS
ncbi:Oidioi.mRNA.OKI2018_I69.XSR.g16041.t1.cds [Oikopleura dioica]|uniref:Oidioi.mRNA.OKI2018_I69.XSR.g16041.t1.cds n=1 Tax=Oikopleura dioica TaxID=34765 RepID=A0ABN7SES2_OIKDI|nr:Oidioi.mRNA.OKI2018_I69.XSR.g16041.t1.cds [Oikopleura dioica]